LFDCPAKPELAASYHRPKNGCEIKTVYIFGLLPTWTGKRPAFRKNRLPNPA
jgi:hypothetical protein